MARNRIAFSEVPALLHETRNLHKLQTLNLIAAGVHLALIFTLIQIGMAYSVNVLSVDTSYDKAGQTVVQSQELFTVNILYVVISYLGLAALAHILTATVFWKRYQNYLRQHRNPMRWIEYSLSCSLMLVALSLGSGIASAGVLFAIFIASMTMNLCGLAFENVNRKIGKVHWSPFIIGSILGSLPWILMFIHLYGFNQSSEAGLTNPVTIHWITLIIFALFPLNMFLSAKRIGPWKSYVSTEMGYITLSFSAKTLLAVLLYFNIV